MVSLRGSLQQLFSDFCGFVRLCGRLDAPSLSAADVRLILVILRLISVVLCLSEGCRASGFHFGFHPACLGSF